MSDRDSRPSRARRHHWGGSSDPRDRRHSLVVVLTFVTGSADAMGFLALGGAFSSVMTGNMVLLGLSAGRADAQLATTSGSAIFSYILGVLLGARIAGTPTAKDSVWPPHVSRALFIELTVLVGFAVAWEITLAGRSDQAQLALLMVAAGSLGVQSSAIQRFGVPGFSSTYLTGTLTSVIGALAARRPWSAPWPSVQVLGALISGAAISAVVTTHLPWLSPFLLLAPLCSVLLLALPLDVRHPQPEIGGRWA